ncbi:MAG TPA: M56 family metallopeptidase [Gammaproteobacteria bacterium]|nr:M56 family metallopeptidase [Gammaproteobacteria bacterium]
MSDVNNWLDTPLAYHLGWTLVHFLWQGALAGIVYAALRHAASRGSPQLRYGLGLLALAMLVALPCFTFAHLASQATGSPQAATMLLQPPTLLAWVRSVLRPYVPWTVPLWCAGVLVMGAKSFSGWRRVQTLAHHAVVAAPPVWRQMLKRLALSVGVRVRVELTLSSKVAVPCVIGWLKPVILLPPAALTGLTPLQLEMVLAHELAHIRRQDYLVNLLQTTVEALLFYHPVVRWISQDIRKERELCCDDAAVRACGDALHYANALADLASLRNSSLAIAQGVDGGELTLRVERLIGVDERVQGAPRLAPLLLASVLCFGGIWAATSIPRTLLPTLRLPVRPLLTNPVSSALAAQHSTALVPAPVPVPLRRTHVKFVEHIDASPVSLVETQEALGSEPIAVLAAPVDIATQADEPKVPAPAVQGYDPNLYSTAPLKVISVHHFESDPPANTPKPHHQERCEPLTGYRVCKP